MTVFNEKLTFFRKIDRSENFFKDQAPRKIRISDENDPFSLKTLPKITKMVFKSELEHNFLASKMTVTDENHENHEKSSF